MLVLLGLARDAIPVRDEDAARAGKVINAKIGSSRKAISECEHDRH